MRRFFKRLGFTLFVAAAAVCAILHVATFLTLVSPMWALPAFFLMFAAAVCTSTIKPRFRLPSRKWGLISCALLAYSVLTFVYFYRTTDGASSVSVVNGQYVSKYKDHILRIITEQEYRMFPNLWARVMSAWIGMTAVFGIMNLRADSR